MPAPHKLRLGILASGSGSNLQAIIDRCADSSIDAEIVLVLSNVPGAGALARAEKAGIATALIDHRTFTARADFDQAVVTALQAADVDLVVLAGFMRIISAPFIAAFPERIINIHPALLPAFPGLHVQRRAIEAGARFAGCTVHFVDGGVDTGPILIQAVVPILDDDNEESLSARILVQEHRVYPRAIQFLAQGRVRIEGRRVRIADAAVVDGVMVNPPLA